jgi:hypothetical protein
MWWTNTIGVYFLQQTSAHLLDSGVKEDGLIILNHAQRTERVDEKIIAMVFPQYLYLARALSDGEAVKEQQEFDT